MLVCIYNGAAASFFQAPGPGFFSDVILGLSTTIVIYSCSEEYEHEIKASDKKAGSCKLIHKRMPAGGAKCDESWYRERMTTCETQARGHRYTHSYGRCSRVKSILTMQIAVTICFTTALHQPSGRGSCHKQVGCLGRLSVCLRSSLGRPSHQSSKTQ